MFDVLYPKFVTDWNKKLSNTVKLREMEETTEAPRTHRSLSPAMLSGQLESSRTGRDCDNDRKPLSPLQARGVAYADQCNEVSDISKTVFDASERDPIAKMRRIAKILRSLPDRDRYYASDPESMHALDRYAKSSWGRFEQEQLTESVSPKQRRRLSSPKNGGYSSDGYSSEGTKEEESASQDLPNGYRAGRSPNGGDRINFEMNTCVDDAAGDAKKRPFFQNYLKSGSGGYEDLDNQSTYHQSTVGSTTTTTTTKVPAEDNPLAAMLQKFAGSDGFSASPLKNVVPISGFSASLYAGKGLPKKRRYRNDVVFPGAVSYGMPSVVGSGGIMAQSGKERSIDHSDVFICHICSFVATSNEDFKLHMTIHYDYQCPHCTYSSRTEGRLKHHIKYFHEAANLDPGDEGTQDSRHFQKTNQPKKFRCRQCHFISYSREEHWNHISVHIKKEKQLKCIHCPFVTEFKHHLEYHIRNHNNSKPYKCSKCNYTCVNKSMLNSHMKSHTNVYQFRCASCKYATKYSHSLKLHLINKRHLPAVVLNPDGSLPTDGSGSFDLISKRGPPRGPCGPRKSKMAADDASPPALMPIFPTSTSSMMSFGHASEFPWIPAAQRNGKPVNGVVIPGGTTLPPSINGALRANAVALPDRSLGYPLNILSQLSSSVASSSVVGYPVVSTSVLASVPCGFCPATFSSLNLLADHVRLEHALRFGGCGVKLEADSLAQEPASGDVHSLSERGGEIEMKRNSVPAEIPLDLSSRNPDGAKRAALKRSAVRDDEDSSCTVSPSSAAMSRKRSRKGKACKLDELSLKLQDHWKEEDGLPDGSESSSMDDECHSGLRGGSGVVGKGSENLETEERKFFEVGCGTSSPVDDRRKELTQYSDADSSDQRHDGVCRSVASGDSSKPAEISDKEPGSGGGNTGGSVTSHAKRGSPARQSPDNGYYTCNHCDMGFRDNVTHFLHMGYHTYDDPFKCNKCGHRSTNAIDFFVHMARVAHAQ